MFQEESRRFSNGILHCPSQLFSLSVCGIPLSNLLNDAMRSISGIRQKRKVVDKLELNEDLTKEDTIKLLQRLVATKTSEIVEIEKDNSEYKERLRQNEDNNCLRYQNSSDLYIVNVPGIDPFQAPCESRLKNGGWTVIQRRLDGSVNFDRNWNEYRNGFGHLKGEFFIDRGTDSQIAVTMAVVPANGPPARLALTPMRRQAAVIIAANPSFEWQMPRQSPSTGRTSNLELEVACGKWQVASGKRRIDVRLR
ncbi:hypothetical protein ACLKA7_002955 [Drosophila subpalustris]